MCQFQFDESDLRVHLIVNLDVLSHLANQMLGLLLAAYRFGELIQP